MLKKPALTTSTTSTTSHTAAIETTTTIPDTIAPDAKTDQQSVWARFWPQSGALSSIDALDGLRAVAVLLVMWCHFNVDLQYNVTDTNFQRLQLVLPFGQFATSGVQLFFVLSGFLLFMPYAKALLGIKPFPSTRKFYIRRALRIFPAYWVNLILYLILTIEPHRLAASPLDAVLHFFMLNNINADGVLTINGVFWTMCIEMQFYLLLPLIAYGLYRAINKGYKRTVITLLFLVFVVGPLVYGILSTYNQNLPSLLADHYTILYVFGYLNVFGTGAVAATFYVAVTEGKLTNLQPATYQKIGFIGLLLLVIHLILTYWTWFNIGSQSPTFGYANFLISNQLQGAAYGAILVAVVLGPKGWRQFLSTPVMRFIGLISYSLYLWHIAVINQLAVPIALLFHSDKVSLVLGWILTLTLSIPVAFISYHYIERPFIQYRREQH